jgi:hypothetical protein
VRQELLVRQELGPQRQELLVRQELGPQRQEQPEQLRAHKTAVLQGLLVQEQLLEQPLSQELLEFQEMLKRVWESQSDLPGRCHSPWH